MRNQQNEPKSVLLRAHFEACEPRLPMTAQGPADFHLVATLVQQPHEHMEDVHSALADVHGPYGVNYVQETFGFNGGGQTVVVIDSGIAYDHYALGGGFGTGFRVVGGWDFTEENDAVPYDDEPAGFHGTHVAGIVGSSDSVHTGVAPEVDLVAVRVFNDLGQGRFDWVENALDWVHENRDAFANPITTVNLSLGAKWYSDDTPSWAMLEDELAQLERDGIFISVAAGNDFQADLGQGLSYPAVSPHVVPVSSVTNVGQFSEFSQRHERVIAAPGQFITSTAPDYLSGFDGVTDDFVTASGTSMASPYVAGASVLIREAMQFVGLENITQKHIYNHMRDTADVFYDPATKAPYHRLNLKSAIQAIMPADDFGGFDNPFDLGTLTGATSLSGLIGQTTDADVFRFTAGQTGSAAVSFASSHDLVSQWEVLGANSAWVDGEMVFDVMAGQHYTFSITTASGIGYYNGNIELTTPVVDWGIVDYFERENETLTSEESWFQITAQRAGMVTVEATFADAQGDVDLELYTTDGTLVSSSNAGSNYERVDVAADQGESLLLHVVGRNADVGFRLANLVGTSGDRLLIAGTSGDDAINIRLGKSIDISVNGIDYSWEASQIATVHIDGSRGDDRLLLTGGVSKEQVQLRPGSVDVSGSGYSIEADDFEQIHVEGAGQDTVVFHDSPGNDQVKAYPDRIILSGNGFHNTAIGFGEARVIASSGYDKAWLFDSAGNDKFVSDPQQSTLHGTGFSNSVEDFDHVLAYSTAGDDTAVLHGSDGNDNLVATPTYRYLTGSGYYNRVTGFGHVDAYASAGDFDRAYFHDSGGDDTLTAGADFAQLGGEGFFTWAAGFDRVDAFSTAGGNDRALLYDSSSDEVLLATPESSQLSGAGFLNIANGFDEVHAYATEGQDVAYLHGSADNDKFVATPSYRYLSGDGFYNRATGFDAVSAYAFGGDFDRAYFHDSPATDSLHARPHQVMLSGPGYSNAAWDFDRTDTFAALGGNDVAWFYDSQWTDTFVSSATQSHMLGPGYINVASGFGTIHAQSTTGTDHAYLWGTTFDDVLTVEDGLARLSGDDMVRSANGFTQLHSTGGGGYDQIDFAALGNADRLVGNGSVVSLKRPDNQVLGEGFELVIATAAKDESYSVEVGAVDYLFQTFGS